MYDKYKEEIANWIADRTLQDPEPDEKTCDYCGRTSIYVDNFDISYRHMSMTQHMCSMCVECYYDMVVIPMDEQWQEYYSSIW